MNVELVDRIPRARNWEEILLVLEHAVDICDKLRAKTAVSNPIVSVYQTLEFLLHVFLHVLPIPQPHSESACQGKVCAAS